MTLHASKTFVGLGNTKVISTDEATSIFQDAAAVNTNIDMSIHALTIALVFEKMQSEQGIAMLKKIVEKTLPKNSTLGTDCELTQVTSNGNMVTFSFKADSKMLATPSPMREYRVREEFTIHPNDFPMENQTHHYDIPNINPWQAYGLSAPNPLYSYNQVPVYTQGNSTTPIAFPVKDTVLNAAHFPFHVPHPIPSPSAPVPPWNKPEPIKKAEPQRVLQSLESILTHTGTGANNGSHIVFFTQLGTYHVFEAGFDGNPDLPGKKLYTAMDMPELTNYFKQLEQEYNDDIVLRGQATHRFLGSLSDKIWYSIEY